MNTFTLKFFAKLREDTETSELEIAVDDVAMLFDLKDYLVAQHPHWAPFLNGKLLTAVNQLMITDDIQLKAGDEVALFPPVTGG